MIKSVTVDVEEERGSSNSLSPQRTNAFIYWSVSGRERPQLHYVSLTLPRKCAE